MQIDTHHPLWAIRSRNISSMRAIVAGLVLAFACALAQDGCAFSIDPRVHRTPQPDRRSGHDRGDGGVCVATAPHDTESRAGKGDTILDAGRASRRPVTGKEFHGRVMASGARFDMNAMVAAHPSYPLGSLVRVTNLANGRSLQLQILDRGPAAGPRADGVIIDASQGAARALGFVRAGRARVRIEVLRWGR